MSAWHGRHLLAAVITAIAVVAVGVGVYVAGSPAEARLHRLDERRIEDLQMARRLIDLYWTQHGLLPATLDSLTRSPIDTARLHDPVTGGPYVYRPSADSAYELCADFARPSETGWRGLPEENWQHPAGRGCFPHLSGRVPR
ncbi:MAG: hypothetical protein ABI587_05185 [Gemmatimonadales bacterium]